MHHHNVDYELNDMYSIYSDISFSSSKFELFKLIQSDNDLFDEENRLMRDNTSSQTQEDSQNSFNSSLMINNPNILIYQRQKQKKMSKKFKKIITKTKNGVALEKNTNKNFTPTKYFMIHQDQTILFWTQIRKSSKKLKRILNKKMERSIEHIRYSSEKEIKQLREALDPKCGENYIKGREEINEVWNELNEFEQKKEKQKEFYTNKETKGPTRKTTHQNELKMNR